MRRTDKSEIGEKGCRWGRMDKGVILAGKSGGVQGLLGNLRVELDGVWLCIPSLTMFFMLPYALDKNESRTK